MITKALIKQSFCDLFKNGLMPVQLNNYGNAALLLN